MKLIIGSSNLSLNSIRGLLFLPIPKPLTNVGVTAVRQDALQYVVTAWLIVVDIADAQNKTGLLGAGPHFPLNLIQAVFCPLNPLERAQDLGKSR